MVLTWMRYNHALTLSRNDHNWRSMFLTCSVHCHETNTTVGACLMHKWYITMLWPLSWDDDNWQSMFHTLGKNNHALTVVMRGWQLMEHVSNINDIFPCSDRCHEMLTTFNGTYTELPSMQRVIKTCTVIRRVARLRPGSLGFNII